MKTRRDVYQAIADPTRRAIIEMIAAEPLDIKTLTEKFEMSQQAVSLHVKLLVDCGLARMEQRGRNRFCHGQLNKLQEVADWVGQYRKFWKFELKDMDAYVDKIRKERSGKQKNDTSHRELRTSRLLDAPVQLVWEIWTQPEHLARWWVPKGTSVTISRLELKPGGKFDWVMQGAGREIDSMSIFRKVVRHRKIVYQNLTTPRFTTTIGFEARGDQTLLNWSVVFEIAGQFTAATTKYGAAEFLNQTVERLARYAVGVNKFH